METAFDLHTNVLFAARWIHYVAGIIWIGHLYFFNFVNANFAKTLDASCKQKVVPELMPRALFWFRWGAMFTLLSGLTIIIWKLWIASDAGFAGDVGLMTSSWGQWSSFGALLGIIMWFNVWFIIWPAQRKIIPAIKAGKAPDAALVKRATHVSKINTYLSIPMLFGMGAASHLPQFNFLIMIGALLLGSTVAWLAFAGAPKISTKV